MEEPMPRRRTFLKLAALSSAGFVVPESVRATDALTRAGRPPDVNRKFYPDGQVMPFAGNTIVCHVAQQGEHSDYFYALLDIYREAQGVDFLKSKVTLLPPSSYHMTIFGGANDKERAPGLWPAFLPLDTPMDDCDRILGERLRTFKLGMDLPIRMRIDPDPLPEGPLTLRLLPADAAQAATLRDLIARLADCLEISPPHIATYRFHTTLGYAIQWLSAEEDARFEVLMDTWRRRIAARSPTIVFGAPEYCLLKDMYAFRRQFYLA